MLNPTAWNWSGKAGYIWGGFCFISATWVYFRLPEPKGRTFAKLDILFEHKVDARKFKSAIVQPFGEGEERVRVAGDVHSERASSMQTFRQRPTYWGKKLGVHMNTGT